MFVCRRGDRWFDARDFGDAGRDARTDRFVCPQVCFCCFIVLIFVLDCRSDVMPIAATSYDLLCGLCGVWVLCMRLLVLFVVVIVVVCMGLLCQFDRLDDMPDVAPGEVRHGFAFG